MNDQRGHFVIESERVIVAKNIWKADTSTDNIKIFREKLSKIMHPQKTVMFCPGTQTGNQGQEGRFSVNYSTGNQINHQNVGSNFGSPFTRIINSQESVEMPRSHMSSEVPKHGFGAENPFKRQAITRSLTDNFSSAGKKEDEVSRNSHGRNSKPQNGEDKKTINLEKVKNILTLDSKTQG